MAFACIKQPMMVLPMLSGIGSLRIVSCSTKSRSVKPIADFTASRSIPLRETSFIGTDGSTGMTVTIALLPPNMGSSWSIVQFGSSHLFIDWSISREREKVEHLGLAIVRN